MPTLEWIGKEKVINHDKEVPFRILEPKYTYDSEGMHEGVATSENMIIHGDNLLALKALLPKYRGKIKCIYIDPPYNTGNEGWIYNDNVNDPQIKKWLGEVVGKEGDDLSRHDKWLCMMYPRLKLLHELLSEDGAIFISIDDNELTNLKLVCDEIYGSKNYVDRITVIVKTEGRRYGQFAKTHENILVYSKNIELIDFHEIEIEGKKYQYFDDIGGFNLKGLRNRNVRAFNSTNRPNLYYPFFVNISETDENNLCSVSVDYLDGYEEVWPQEIDGLKSVWRWGKDKSRLDNHLLCAYKGNDGIIRVFQKERKLTETPKTVWIDKNFTSIFGTKEQKNIFGSAVFEFPKPSKLIERIIEIGSDVSNQTIILDSFAGSGTTAHAVLNMNKHDGGNRKFILVELGDYAETVTAERVRRVINGYGEGKNAVDGTGGSFTFHELGPQLFDENGNLNEEVGTDRIREYIWFTETQRPLASHDGDNKAFLGVANDCAYYFHYDTDATTTLDHEFMATIKTKADSYVIYADICSLDDDFLSKHHITFKKIPRDIARI